MSVPLVPGYRCHDYDDSGVPQEDGEPDKGSEMLDAVNGRSIAADEGALVKPASGPARESIRARFGSSPANVTATTEPSRFMASANHSSDGRKSSSSSSRLSCGSIAESVERHLQSLPAREIGLAVGSDLYDAEGHVNSISRNDFNGPHFQATASHEAKLSFPDAEQRLYTPTVERSSRHLRSGGSSSNSSSSSSSNRSSIATGATSSASPPAITDESLAASGKRRRQSLTQDVHQAPVVGGEAQGPAQYPSERAPSARPRRSSSTTSHSPGDSSSSESSSSAQCPPPDTLMRRRYELIVIQEPFTGCAFGSDTLARIPCEPPLVLNLRAYDEEAECYVPLDDEAPWLICNLRLLAQDGAPADMLVPSQSIQSSAATSGESEGHPSSQGPAVRRASPAAAGAGAAGSNVRTSTEEVRVASGTNSPGAVRMLYGSLVANAQMLYTPEGNHRPHFIFPEVCIRSQGYFQLQANLMRLPSAGGSTTGALATVTTSAFAVHLSRNYNAPHLTDTTRFYARQGANIPVPPSERDD
ncbi:unnamed protein product [Jaminaea pallidilutea]